MVAVTKPSPSTLIRQDSIQVEVVFFSLSSGSKDELPPLGSRQAAMPVAATKAGGTQLIALALQTFVVGVSQHLGDHGVIIAAVVMRAARDEIGKLLTA